VILIAGALAVQFLVTHTSYMQIKQPHFSLPEHPFLTNDGAHRPYQIIAELCCSYHLKDIRTMQWEMLKAALTSDYFQSSKERSNAIFYHECLLTALEAVYMLHEKKRNKKNHTQKKK
jgi:hypothetical protein